MAFGDWLTLLDARIQDTAVKLSVFEKNSAIAEAVKRYSLDSPRERVQTIVGTGIAFTFALAADFEDGFSQVRSVEYPVGQQDPEYLDENSYRLYLDPSTGVLKLRLLDLVIPTTQTAYVVYTTQHSVTVSPAADTVPVIDRESTVSLAASVCARQLAMLYAQTSDSTLGAESVAYRAKSYEYLALAKDLEAVYSNRGVIDEKSITAASAMLDLDVPMQGTLRTPRFFHGPGAR